MKNKSFFIFLEKLVRFKTLHIRPRRLYYFFCCTWSGTHNTCGAQTISCRCSLLIYCYDFHLFHETTFLVDFRNLYSGPNLCILLHSIPMRRKNAPFMSSTQRNPIIGAYLFGIGSATWAITRLKILWSTMKESLVVRMLRRQTRSLWRNDRFLEQFFRYKSFGVRQATWIVVTER